MRFTGMSLADVAATVAEHLKVHGIDVVVVGGSAITSHVPTVYTSMDVDFAITSDANRRQITTALKELGYEFAEIQTSFGRFRVLKLEDAIADRVAAFLHWSDSEALDVAQRSAAAARDRLTWERIDASLQKLDTKLPDSAMRMNIARGRLRRALDGK